MKLHFVIAFILCGLYGQTRAELIDKNRWLYASNQASAITDELDRFYEVDISKMETPFNFRPLNQMLERELKNPHSMSLNIDRVAEMLQIDVYARYGPHKQAKYPSIIDAVVKKSFSLANLFRFMNQQYFYDLLDQHLKYMEAHLQNNKNEVINQQVERLVSIVFIQLKVNFDVQNLPMERISNMLEINHEHNGEYQTRKLANKIFLLKHYMGVKYAFERNGNEIIEPRMCVKVNVSTATMDQCGLFWDRAKIIRLPRDIKHRENGLSLESMEFNQVAHLVFLMIDETANQQKIDNSKLRFVSAVKAAIMLDLIDKKESQLDAENREFRKRLDFDRPLLHKTVLSRLQIEHSDDGQRAEKLEETDLLRIYAYTLLAELKQTQPSDTVAKALIKLINGVMAEYYVIDAELIDMLLEIYKLLPQHPQLHSEFAQGHNTELSDTATMITKVFQENDKRPKIESQIRKIIDELKSKKSFSDPATQLLVREFIIIVRNFHVFFDCPLCYRYFGVNDTLIEEMTVMMWRLEIYYNKSSAKDDRNRFLLKSEQINFISRTWTWLDSYNKHKVLVQKGFEIIKLLGTMQHHAANADNGPIFELAEKLTELEQLIENDKDTVYVMLPVQNYLTEILRLVEGDAELKNVMVHNRQHKESNQAPEQPKPKRLSQLTIFARLKTFQKRHDKMMKIRTEGEGKIRAPGGIQQWYQQTVDRLLFTNAHDSTNAAPDKLTPSEQFDEDVETLYLMTCHMRYLEDMGGVPVENTTVASMHILFSALDTRASKWSSISFKHSPFMKELKMKMKLFAGRTDFLDMNIAVASLVLKIKELELSDNNPAAISFNVNALMGKVAEAFSTTQPIHIKAGVQCGVSKLLAKYGRFVTKPNDMHKARLEKTCHFVEKLYKDRLADKTWAQIFEPYLIELDVTKAPKPTGSINASEMALLVAEFNDFAKTTHIPNDEKFKIYVAHTVLVSTTSIPELKVIYESNHDFISNGIALSVVKQIAERTVEALKTPFDTTVAACQKWSRFLLILGAERKVLGLPPTEFFHYLGKDGVVAKLYEQDLKMQAHCTSPTSDIHFPINFVDTVFVSKTPFTRREYDNLIESEARLVLANLKDETEYAAHFAKFKQLTAKYHEYFTLCYAKHIVAGVLEMNVSNEFDRVFGNLLPLLPEDPIDA